MPWLHIGPELSDGVTFRRVRLTVAFSKYARDGAASAWGRSEMPKPLCEFSTGLKRIDRVSWEQILGDAEDRLRPALADVPKQLKRLCKSY